MQRPIDEDVWRGDVELGWPWVWIKHNSMALGS